MKDDYSSIPLTAARFRLVVIINGLLLLVWFTHSWLSPTPTPDVARILALNGYGGTVLGLEQLYITFAFFFVRCLALPGIFFFRAWGKWLFWLSIFMQAAVAPFAGIGVYRPAEIFIGLALTLADGALAALLIFKFKSINSTETRVVPS